MGYRADYRQVTTWEAQREVIATIGALGGSKKAGKDVVEVWLDEVAQQARMRTLDELKEKNNRLIAYVHGRK